MKTTDRLLADAAEIWEGYHKHPFVKGICEGTLDSESNHVEGNRQVIRYYKSAPGDHSRKAGPLRHDSRNVRVAEIAV